MRYIIRFAAVLPRALGIYTRTRMLHNRRKQCTVCGVSLLLHHLRRLNILLKTAAAGIVFSGKHPASGHSFDYLPRMFTDCDYIGIVNIYFSSGLCRKSFKQLIIVFYETQKRPASFKVSSLAENMKIEKNIPEKIRQKIFIQLRYSSAAVSVKRFLRLSEIHAIFKYCVFH